jgi:hypothetical protein
MNELIEKFWIEQGGKPHDPADLWFYESDWGMLMPVVEKINKMKNFAVNINFDHNGVNSIYECSIEKNFWERSHFNRTPLVARRDIYLPMINVVYNTVVEFIKWYNDEDRNNISKKV